MDRKFWDDIFENYNSEIFDVFKSDKNGIIKLWINDVASSRKTVADFGCGIGKWLPLLSRQFGEVFAIDFSSSNLKYNKGKYKTFKNINYQNIDMTQRIESSYNFDVILCVNAILNAAHSKRKNFFTNIFTNLNTKGHLILVVPSLESVLYSEFISAKCDHKGGSNTKKTTRRIGKNEYIKFKQGIVNIDAIPTKHYLREELISTLNEIGFKIVKFDKVKYPWSTEIANFPKSLKAPYPWDWVVMATKNKK
ncbi:MAG: class I SAM-dependent methyltransferase [Candidatus Edwardsbacteria bacterium]|nr:class I SAM-dependent methyltransferase [Candidatus Edwardsbacteria bacterium]MBU1576056.1 class I SAM-dependent methyltransferase [Candidatus Edwardsbacteria bacterium]MBU2594126.1 class I SAM-dependent methyltransferase [Candidatus Edwardsbacteria bacterium]